MGWWLCQTVSKFEQTIIEMVKWWWLYLTQLIGYGMVNVSDSIQVWANYYYHDSKVMVTVSDSIKLVHGLMCGGETWDGWAWSPYHHHHHQPSESGHLRGPQPVCCHCRLIMTHHHHNPTNITCTTHFLGLFISNIGQNYTCHQRKCILWLWGFSFLPHDVSI